REPDYCVLNIFLTKIGSLAVWRGCLCDSVRAFAHGIRNLTDRSIISTGNCKERPLPSRSSLLVTTADSRAALSQFDKYCSHRPVAGRGRTFHTSKTAHRAVATAALFNLL